MRKTELEKIDTLEEKLDAELAAINGRMEQLQADIARFEDLETLQKEGVEKKERLHKERTELQQQAAMVDDIAGAVEGAEQGGTSTVRLCYTSATLRMAF